MPQGRTRWRRLETVSVSRAAEAAAPGLLAWCRGGGCTLTRRARRTRRPTATRTRCSSMAGRGACAPPAPRPRAALTASRRASPHRSGNPGPAGAGAVLLSDRDTPVAEAGVWLGPHSTNNEAEYTGLIAGLRLAARCGVQRLRVQGGTPPVIAQSLRKGKRQKTCAERLLRADSTLVTRQMKGEWRCAAPGLLPLQAQAAAAAEAFEAIHYAYIPRAENSRVRPNLFKPRFVGD